MSKFPNEIDTDAELPSVIDGSTEIAGEVINAHKDALLAIERTLGTDPQGSAASLADRLDVSINADGTLNSTAIAAAWLLSSPITNAHVSSAAAIDESKINLDVPTALLQDQITDLTIDVEALQGSVAAEVAQLAGHITGTDDRHIAQHIIVSPSVASGSNVQTALQNAYTALNDHISDPVGAHDADAVSYSPSPGSNLTASSVGGALDEIDSNFINRVNRHLDTAHSNGVSSDGYVYLGGQGAVNAASLATVPFQPLGGQPRIKIGGINHATLISRGANPAGLGSTASAVVVDYSDGYSLYTVDVTGLNSVPYPTGSENRLRGVVSKFNEAFRTAGALVTAFQYQNEVVLQHNTPDGYIVVRAPSIASAADVLGFSAVVGQEVQPISHLISVTDGIPLDAWTPLASGPITLSGSSVSLVLSAAVAVGSLLHIVSHTALGAGTYQVVAAVGTSVTLNRPVPAGTFSYSVFPDSLGLGAISSGTTYEVFVNSSGVPSAYSRANITISQISGVRISECRLQPGTYTLSLTGTGSNRSAFLSSGTSTGRAATLAQGYLGQLVLEAPLGLGTATLDVVSLSPSSPATDTFVVTESAENDDLQLICSYWSNGSVAEFPTDARNLGLVNSAALATDVFTRSLAAFPSNRINGFVSGGAPAGAGSSSLQMPASKVMIGGVIKSLPAATIDFAGIPVAYGTYNLYIDLAGSLRLGLESGTGTSLSSILVRGEVPVARVVHTGLLDITDIRLFSLPVPPSDRLLVAGSPGTYHCSGIAGALLVAEAGGFRKVVMQGDQSVTSDVVIPPNIGVEGPAALTCRTLSLGASSAITVSDITTTVTTPTVVGVSALDTGTIDAKNITTRSVSLSEYSSLRFLSCSLTGSSGSGIVTLSISGAGVSIAGAAPGATLSFASGGTASVAAVSDLRIADLSAVFDSAQFDWMAISGVCDRIVFDGLSMQRSGSISAAQIGTHSAVSNTGTISNIVMRDCSFAECGKILSNAGTIEFVSMSGCSGSNFGGLLRSASSAAVSGAALSEFYGYRLYGNVLEMSGTANVTLSDSVFYGTFGASQTRARAFYSTDATATPSSVSATISKCTFSGIAFEDYFIAATGLLLASSVRLDISDCAFSGISSSISQSNRASAAGNLIYWNSDARLRISGCSMLSCAFKIAMGYNFELSGNAIEISASATERQLFNISKSIPATDPAYLRPLAKLDENSIAVDGLSLVQLSSVSLNGNSIAADRFIFDYGVSDSPLPLAAGYAVSGNSFESTDATAGTAFVIYPGYIADSNKFYGQSTGNLLTLGTLSSGTGFLKFTNNACSYLPPSPAQAILSIDDGPLSGVKYLLSSNIIQLADPAGSAVDNAIQIAPNNVVCSQNYIVGDSITGVIFRAVGSGQSGCRMTENVISGGTADGTDLPSDTNTFENNRGIANTYSLSPFGTLLSDPADWTSSGTEISSSANGAVAWIRIDTPAGELLEVAGGFDFSAVSGSVTLQLYTVSSTSTASTLVGSATLTPTSIGYASASIIPSTAPFIGPLKTAALKITRNAGSATVKLGNIRAVVKL